MPYCTSIQSSRRLLPDAAISRAHLDGKGSWHGRGGLSPLRAFRRRPFRQDGPYVGGGEKGYQNGGEVVPCQGGRSEMIAEEGKAGDRSAKGGPPFWYPRPPPLTEILAPPASGSDDAYRFHHEIERVSGDLYRNQHGGRAECLYSCDRGS